MPPVLSEQVLHRLMAGDAEVIAAVVEGLRATDDPTILVAAVLFADADPAASLARATAIADTTRDRQLVAIAAAHLRGERDVVDAPRPPAPSTRRR